MHRLPCWITSNPTKAPQLFQVEVQTTCVLPRLVLEPRRVDFGQIAIGRTEVFSVTVRNLGTTTLTLTVEPMASASPFTLLNGVRPLPAGRSQILLVQCRPQAERNLTDELVLRCEATRVSVKLAARGVAPKVALEPAGPVIDVGDGMCGDTISTPLVVRNLSVFPLPFEIVTKATGERNFCGYQPFHFVPSEGVIPPEETRTVQIYFSPDHQSTQYQQLIKVEVPNGSDKQLLQLQARAWDRAVYLLEEPLPAAPAGAASAPLSSARAGTPLAAAAATPPPPRPTRIADIAPVNVEDPFSFLQLDTVPGRTVTLTFAPAPLVAAADEATPLERVRQLHLGACQAADSAVAGIVLLAALKPGSVPAAGGGAGSFAIDLADKSGAWSVDTASGTTTPGQRTLVSFKFNVTKYRTQTKSALIAHWVTAKAKVTLKGGAASTGAAEETVEIVCRIFMESSE